MGGGGGQALWALLGIPEAWAYQDRGAAQARLASQGVLVFMACRGKGGFQDSWAYLGSMG